MDLEHLYSRTEQEHVLFDIAAKARRMVMGEEKLGEKNGCGWCGSTSKKMVQMLHTDGTIAARVAYGNYHPGGGHSWVVLDELGLYVDPTHDQFKADTVIRIGQITDEDYNRDYFFMGWDGN